MRFLCMIGLHEFEWEETEYLARNIIRGVVVSENPAAVVRGKCKCCGFVKVRAI